MKHMTKRTLRLGVLVLVSAHLSACLGTGRPQHTSIRDTLEQATREPVVPTTVMLPQKPPRNPGSLWQAGAKSFFKDSRASDVGDIITVVVNENSEAETEANTETTKEYEGNSGLQSLLNLTGKLTSRGIATTPEGLFDHESAREFTGEGSTDRSDSLTARIAAVVTQVLPNGYLVIQGKREVVINYELQELAIQGIVRPEDINADNTINSEKVAEARITYAGRGVVDEAQEPAKGVRFLDKWMPF